MFKLSIKITTILLLIAYVVISFWLFYPYKPIVIASPIVIQNKDKQVMPGDELVYELDMDKRIALPVTVSKQLVDGVVITYAPLIGNLPMGKYKQNFSVTVPKFAAAGVYKLKWEGIYHVNPMREISVIAWSEPFEVCEVCK